MRLIDTVSGEEVTAENYPTLKGAKLKVSPNDTPLLDETLDDVIEFFFYDVGEGNDTFEDHMANFEDDVKGLESALAKGNATAEDLSYAMRHSDYGNEIGGNAPGLMVFHNKEDFFEFMSRYGYDIDPEQTFSEAFDEYDFPEIGFSLEGPGSTIMAEVYD